MAFTVEDGTVVANANAYMTVAQYREHHTDRGRTADDTAQPDANVQAAIILATDYIDKRWGRRFRGERYSSQQALEWPRTDAWDDDEYTLPAMPDQLLKGCAEYAWVQLTLGAGLSLTPIPDGTGGTVEEKTEKVGPITDTTKFARRPMSDTGNLIQNIPEYPQADLWMEELIEGSDFKEFERG